MQVLQYKSFMRKVIKHFKRILTSTGNLLIHVSPEAGIYIKPLLYEIFTELQFRQEIVVQRPKWLIDREKEKGTYEQILFWAMSEKSINNFDRELIERGYEEDSEQVRDYLYQGQKSVKLMERLIAMTTNPGDTVLDVFAGSGTTLITAHKLGRNWIGCDTSEEGCTIAKNWLANDFDVNFETIVYGDQSYLESKYPIVRKHGKFFLSYSSKNHNEFVKPFHETLTQLDIEHWWDKKDIPAGAEWERRINQGLDECDALVLFITPESMQSEWVQREYESFLKAGKKIFPVICSEPTSIPDSISRFQYTKYAKYQENLLPQLLKYNPDTN